MEGVEYSSFNKSAIARFFKTFYISCLFFEKARNLGTKIFPSIKCKIAEACHKAWKKRALALIKNLFSRNPCSRLCWIHYQTDSRNLNGIINPSGKRKKWKKRKLLE